MEEREPLLQGLKEWYDEEVGNVKIVVSIRSDLYYRMNEVQQCLGYNLGALDVFELKKFSAEQATQVLKAIAETENLPFDEGFLAQLTEDELADKEDRLISPVDLQILAWMITAQNTSELRVFNRKAFQKLGGVEELLSRYLQEVLRAQTMKTRREAAMKVLLALTDLEQQVRSEVLTLEELAAKNPHVQSQEVKAAVKWLVDVRLITPVEKDNSEGYELAHERLIGAVMEQANQELTNVSRANQLLERRVNEWLGNNCSHRYLLPWGELWFIERNKSHWGSKRKEKQRLLARSRRRIYRFASVFIVFALMMVSFIGWLKFTPQGQIHWVYWSITNPWDKHLVKISDEKAAEVAVAIANYGKWEYALKLVQEHIEEDRARASFLSEFSKVITQQHNLEPALALAKDIENSSYRSEALSAIAAAYGELGDTNAALEGLKDSLKAAKDIENSYYRSRALSAIAAAYGKLGDTNAALETLKDSLKAAKEIENSYSRSEVLSAIAAAYGKLGDTNAALEGLKDSLNAAEQIGNLYFRSRALRAIAAAYGELGDTNAALEGLKDSLNAAEQIGNSYNRSEALSAIAAAYGKLGDTNAAQERLKDLLKAAKEIDDSYSRSEVLSAIAAAYGELGDSNTAQERLKDSLKAAEDIESSYHRRKALRAIAAAARQLPNPMRHVILQDTLAVAEAMNANEALAEISYQYAQNRAWGKALHALRHCDDSNKVPALTKILTEWSKQSAVSN